MKVVKMFVHMQACYECFPRSHFYLNMRSNKFSRFCDVVDEHIMATSRGSREITSTCGDMPAPLYKQLILHHNHSFLSWNA